MHYVKEGLSFSKIRILVPLTSKLLMSDQYQLTVFQPCDCYYRGYCLYSIIICG